jgi:ABC-type bacteriocin/lantibiotic exporter with double-glycine peptidase domain
LSLVRQGSEKGCGIACVAMVTGSDYAALKELLSAVRTDSLDKWRGKGTITTAHDIAALLQRLNLKFRCLDFRSLFDLRNCGVVAVESHKKKKKKHYHWIVVTKIDGTWYVLDPAAGDKWGPPGNICRRIVREEPNGVLVTNDLVYGEKAYFPRKNERSFEIHFGGCLQIKGAMKWSH